MQSISQLSQTHNQILKDAHSILTHQYLQERKDKAIHLLDKLYQHATDRINHTFHQIEQTLKECKKEQHTIHNSNYIHLDTHNQHRRSLECSLRKPNNYIYHYCIMWKGKQLSDCKLPSSVVVIHLSISLSMTSRRQPNTTTQCNL
eukprot:376489_1